MSTMANAVRFLAAGAAVIATAIVFARVPKSIGARTTSAARKTGAATRETTLRAAIQLGNVKAVAAALDRGARVNRVMPGLNEPDGGFTPLNAAVLIGDPRIVRLLLRRGANIEAGDGWYATPLIAATADEKMEMMRLLIAHGARVNDRRQGSRALWVAATTGKIAATTLLLAQGANKDTRQEGATLLHALQAQGLGSSEAARLLRMNGATE
jgi:hypothetical protein